MLGNKSKSTVLRKLCKSFFSPFLLVYWSIGLFSPVASAHTVTVKPSILQLDLSVASPEAALTYTNDAPIPIEISLSSQDIKELENGYQLSYLSPKDANNYHYGLSSWIHFSETTMVLDPKETKTLTVFIDKAKLRPGGHYATILASINPQAKYTEQVQVKGILASLLFVRTNTGTTYEHAAVATFDLTRNLFDFPDTAYFRFNNLGDIDETPHGLVQIFDSSNQLIAKGIVNETSAPTLPESIRRYYVSLRNLTPFILPGWYKAHLWVHYGQSNQERSSQFSFFSFGSIPSMVVGLLLLLLTAAAWWKRRR